MTAPSVTPWSAPGAPTEEALDALLHREGLTPRWWSNGPGDRYGAHSHPYHKVLYCARGSVRFLVEGDHMFELLPGDRLDLPPDTSHSAIVGPAGVACVEAARSG
jgi:quercetin dioxygenase-like cupin family protein